MEARPPAACRDSPPGRADTKLAFCKWNRPVLAPNTSFVSRVGGLSPKIEGPGLQNAGLAPLSARRAYKTRIRCQRAPRALTKLAFGARGRSIPLHNSFRATNRLTHGQRGSPMQPSRGDPMAKSPGNQDAQDTEWQETRGIRKPMVADQPKCLANFLICEVSCHFLPPGAPEHPD